MIDKQSCLPQALLGLTGTKQQSAAPATDICYKSLAISSVESERQRKPEREEGESDKKRGRHLSLEAMSSIGFYFELNIHVPSFAFSLPS